MTFLCHLWDHAIHSDHIAFKGYLDNLGKPLYSTLMTMALGKAMPSIIMTILLLSADQHNIIIKVILATSAQFPLMWIINRPIWSHFHCPGKSCKSSDLLLRIWFTQAIYLSIKIHSLRDCPISDAHKIWLPSTLHDHKECWALSINICPWSFPITTGARASAHPYTVTATDRPNLLI